MNQLQMEAAKKAMTEWLADPHELGKSPIKIECAQEFDLHGLHYYIFRFKKSLLGEWLLGVCGGYEENELDHCGHIFSEMKKYDARTAVDDAAEIVEKIRSYWMQQAAQHEKAQEVFKKNLKYISQTEIKADGIRRQFVKSQSRYHLTVGRIDCPTGRIVVADPIYYLPSGECSPQLAISVPPGSYPVEVSICRNDAVGIRMCTARLKLRDTEAVRYQCAEPTEETAAAKFSDGIMTGFPVDAGVMAFCDAQAAEEYRAFLNSWKEENPGKNLYTDYFASFFAESEERLPAYQRKGGDFIEWKNPETGRRMVMISSGFGDGFYQCFWGYDEEDSLCELIVPMVNPDLFRELEEEPLLKDWDGPDGCIVSNRIIRDGCRVGFCYREKPDDSDFGKQDSGWRFTAGDESDAYINTPENCGIYSLNTLCGCDPDVIPFLKAPYGSAFERGRDGKFQEITDWAPPAE